MFLSAKLDCDGLSFCWLAACLISGWSSVLSAEDRWEGRLADGQVVKTESISDWCEPNAVPTVAGRKVLDPNQPFVSLVDLQATTVDAAA